MTGLTLSEIAKALGGEVRNGEVRAPGPGHSAKDRSLTVILSGDDGYVVKSFADDDWQKCRDHVREKLRLPPFKPNGHDKTVRTITYDYRDASGVVRYHKKRFDRDDGAKFYCFYQLDGTKGIGGTPHLLYGGERLADLSDGQPMWIVEGEKKVDRLRELGAIAVSGDTGHGSKWLPEHVELLRGLPVIFWPDSDSPGEKYIANAAAAIRAVNPGADIRVVRPFGPPDGAKGRDVCNWTGNAEHLAELAAGAQPYAPLPIGNGDVAPCNPPDKPPAPFANIINPADWEGLPVPEREWIVPDYIPDETITLLSGDGGQGKSLLALQLAVARALAREWIGLMPSPGKTLILSAEDGCDELHRRLDRIRKSSVYNASWDDLGKHMRLIDLVGENSVLGGLKNGQIVPTEMYRTLDAFMTEFKPSLTTLDVLADMFGGDEIKRAQVRQFILLLKQLARKHKCAILLLAHPSLTGMNTGTGLSGSTDWNNCVRARMYLQTPKTNTDETLNQNLRTLQGMKSNYGERGGKIDLEWKNGLFIPVHSPAASTGLPPSKKPMMCSCGS